MTSILKANELDDFDMMCMYQIQLLLLLLLLVLFWYCPWDANRLSVHSVLHDLVAASTINYQRPTVGWLIDGATTMSYSTV